MKELVGLVEKMILEIGDRRQNFTAQNQTFSTNYINKQASGEDVS